ncbi:MAG: phosphatase PAP2 family protein [Pelolinea sp.]|nr:phosphatase PAP2 family protein [Pelolinea sp.]
MIKKILELDQNLSQYLFLPEDKILLRKSAMFFAHSGDSWFLEIGFLLIWLFSSGIWHTYSALFAGAIVIQAVFVIALKFLIKRRRPEGDWGAVYRNADPHSFPSGHAARVMMLAFMCFGLGLPQLGWIVLFWGICVSFARVSLGVHYLIDIFAGWLIGILLANVILTAQPIFYNLIPVVF